MAEMSPQYHMLKRNCSISNLAHTLVSYLRMVLYIYETMEETSLAVFQFQQMAVQLITENYCQFISFLNHKFQDFPGP